jgi:hypothetical protein
VNPASLAGESGSLEPYFNLTWLQVDDVGTASDQRPRITETLCPTWGFHLYDVNVGLGNLVGDVRAQEQATRPPHAESEPVDWGSTVPGDGWRCHRAVRIRILDCGSGRV